MLLTIYQLKRCTVYGEHLISINLWDLSEGKCIPRTMSKIKIILLCTVTVLVSCLMTNGCEARRIQYDGDLEAAASDKREWKKGNKKDHHQSDSAEHGKNSKEGYESKHGYDQLIYHIFFHSLRFCSIHCFERCLKRIFWVFWDWRLNEYRWILFAFVWCGFHLKFNFFFFLLPIPNIVKWKAKAAIMIKNSTKGNMMKKKGIRKSITMIPGEWFFYFHSKVSVYYLAWWWCWWWISNVFICQNLPFYHLWACLMFKHGIFVCHCR